MENVNLHKSKIIALIITAIGLISFFLPWWHVNYAGYFGLGVQGGVSINGFHKLGIIAFIAFCGVPVVTLAMGDKTKAYMGQEKMIAAGCFGGAALFTIIDIVANTKSLSFGGFIALAAAIIGALFVWGMVKMPETKPPAPPAPPAPPKA